MHLTIETQITLSKTEFKGEREISTIIVGDFSTPLLRLE